MKKILALVAIVLTTFALSASARADLITFGGTLNAAQEFPPPDVPPNYMGIGTAMSILDTNTRILETMMTWSNLTGNLIATHIHNSGGEPAGPVIIPFVNPPDPPRPPSGSEMFTNNLTAGQFESLMSGLSRGFIYFNIHTMQNPGGEIRANVAPIPEPSAWVLFGIGAVGLLASRRFCKG